MTLPVMSVPRDMISQSGPPGCRLGLGRGGGIAEVGRGYVKAEVRHDVHWLVVRVEAAFMAECSVWFDDEK